MSRAKMPTKTNLTHTLEGYLMTMYVMERDQGDIIAGRLAEMLNVSPATVAMTFKRMKRNRWMSGKGHEGFRLADTGQVAARSVIRYFACGEDLSLDPVDIPLPEKVVTGTEPFRIVGAMAGG